MKGNPKMISTDTHQQFSRALKPAIAKPFPEPTRNITTISQLGLGESPIEVFPPEVFFKDIEPNQNYEVTVTIRNITKNLKRFKFTKPQTSNFRCDYENIGNVAAGLTVKLNIQFECNSEGDFHDMIEIGCEGYSTPYQLHLHAFQPAPDIQFEPFVNMRFIPNGEVRYQQVEFKNEGRIAGFVTLEDESRSKTGFSLEPSNFDIKPGQIVSVRVGMTGTQAENLVKKVKVQVAGQSKQNKIMEVSATCIEQSLSIVFNEGGGIKSSLNFGTVYMGERREYPAFLVNNGPQPANFKFKFLQGLRNLEDENSSTQQDNFVSPAEVGKEMTERVLTAFPLSGVVGPYEQIPLQFICRTKKHEKTGGFADLTSAGPSKDLSKTAKYVVSPEDYATLAVMSFGENGNGIQHQDLKVQMMARAMYPDIKINKQLLNFGECPCNERRDMVLTVKNKNKDLILDFSFSKVAHFKAVPLKGKLFPDSEHNINISFEPKSLGMFKQEIMLEILNGLYKIPVQLEGNCRAVGTKSKGVRGPAAKVSDFEPELNVIDDEQAAMTTLQETVKRRYSKEDPALAGISDADLEAKSREVQIYLANKANKERFNNYVKHERIDRAVDNRIHQKIKETGKAPPKTLEEIEKDLDLGMNYDIGVPKFEAYQGIDPLYVERPIAHYEPQYNKDKMRAKQELMSDKLVKRKFKPEPVTQTELKDCATELTGQQLQKIAVGPQRINFKNVFVKSQATKSFVVTNDLRQNIYVRLMVDAYPELQMSSPLSQVIPPGQEAGFDIVFCSQTVKSFTGPITYYINDRPFNFLVTAQADPVSLELSKKKLQFQFNEESMEMSATQSLMLTNYGNAPAKFTWQFPSQIFVPKPISDEVPAGSSLKVDVVFNPNGPKTDEEVLFLKIQDGESEELKCSGQVSEAKCIFLEKQLDFGNVHVGLQAKDRTVHIKNQLRTPAIFHVQCDAKELQIFPLKGKIQGDSKFAFKVSFISNQVKSLKSEIVVNIRGGKPLRIPVLVNSIVPEIYIEEKAIDFGGITFGDQKTLPLTIVNESDITAKVILDMREYPEFDFILPEPSPDDDVHSEIMVPIVENAKYEDIVNMNADDVDPLNAEEKEEEEDEYDEDAKRYVQLSIRPSTQPFVLQLKYQPQGIEDPKNFILPLKLAGFNETVAGLRRRIKAVGVKPRFFVDPTTVNFKTKVIAKGQKPLPFHQDIQIQNPDPNKPVSWRVDREKLEASKVFSMNPFEGTLEPNSHSIVRVTFNPHEPTEYVTKIPLFLDNEKEVPYLIMELRGEGADAKIYFDRREIILPPVPLDIETRATFQVCHNGYENQILRCKIANEVGQLPITILYPDGENLGVTKQKVKVEAVFKFSSPLSFTTFLDFFDDEGNKFSIPISGTTDNSIFTVYSFLQRHYDEIVYRHEKGKPIKLDQSVSSDIESQKTGGFVAANPKTYSKQASSVISRTAKSLVGYNPVPSDILEKNCEHVCRWFNASLNTTSMQSFPQDIITQNGAQMYDLITYLSGKRPPGQASQKAIATANQANAKDALKVLLNQYEELINYLKVNGAHLNTVRPEYLLNTGDYTKFLKMFPKEENMKPKVVERVFPYIAMESWLTIFYQVLRIYYLNRITAKNFKALPGLTPAEAIVDPQMTKSNIYSVAETILLKWMSYHVNLINPTQAHQLTNFDADLQDSTVFACLIRSHYGETNSLKQFRMIATNQEQTLNNAKMIIKACDEIGIQTHILPQDIAEPSARELMLFCIQLYQSLPHYVPKASIEFPAVLGDLVTKNIELSNPSKNPISYWVKLIGSSDFSIEQEQVRIEPGQSVAFPVRFQSRISTLVKGKVIFTNKKEGNIQAAALVFELVSNVYERNSVEIIQKSTKLYKALQIDLQVENAFPQDVVFNVQIQYDRNQKDAAGKKKDSKSAPAPPPAATNSKGKKEDVKQIGTKKEQSGVPEPFFIKNDVLKIRKGTQGTIAILFLPFELGIHKANIIFTDENVGEVQYTIIGKSELPEILDTFTGDCNSEEPFSFKKVINFKNDKLEQARNQQAEQSKKQTAKMSQHEEKESRKAAAVVSTANVVAEAQKVFEIEISNPFFTGPSSITLLDLAAPKIQQTTGGKATNQPQGGKDAKSASAQEFNPNQNLLELNCNPSKPASYTCYVILKSLDRTDIRLYEYKLTAIPQKIRAQLEFRVPARGSVTQDIPIVNNSSQEWKVVAQLDQSKNGCFNINPPTTKVVKKGMTENFSLTFKPLWVCEVTGTLTLKNESTKEEYEYELKGIGEEPLAEDHIVLSCKARETCTHTFEIKNPSEKPVTYTVWTDLQNAVGTKEFTIKPKQSYEYPLRITPLLGGVYTASITFQDNEEKFIWWTVEVRTDSPKPEATIDMRAVIRKATSAEISLSNPLNEPITFEVFYQGDGLLGDQAFSLEPKSVSTYNLIFSPLQAGFAQGNIGFLNEKVGEFWYDLSLTADESPTQNLELLECELGRMASHNIELENPTGNELFLDFKNSNPTNFEIKPDKVILPPYESLKVQIQYSPTTLDQVESGNIIFSHPQVGKWEYNVEGKGLVPTIMEPQPISTAVGNSTSSMLIFKNPFKEPAQVQVSLESKDTKIFSMLLKRNKFSMGPLGILQIPYSFSPETMTESKATIVVSMSKQLVWKYPLRGIAESASNTINYHFRTRARQPFEESIKIVLPGFQLINLEDTFHYELNVLQQSHQGLIDRSVFVEQKTNSLQNAEDPLVFDLRFEPLRPFKTNVEFIIYKSSGGRWKFNVIFEALDPEIDDSIVIQSPLHKTSSVSFKLSNHLKSFADFHAFFTTDSAAEFTVYPKSGQLEPYGKEGTNFIVSFTPTEYGKAKTGRLVIQTEEMQWTYEIKGSHPHYQIPKVQGGRIENKLSKDLQNKMQSAHTQQKNFLVKNLRANQFTKSPGRNSSDNITGIKRANHSPSAQKHETSLTRKSRDNSPSQGK